MTKLPVEIAGTGKFATKDEIEDVYRPRRVMFLPGGRSMGETAHRAAHRYALAHGLPEIQGHYGMTPEGEFVCLEEDATPVQSEKENG
jgi:hypothetical protein